MGDNYPYNQGPPTFYAYGNNTQPQGYNIYQPMNPNYLQNQDRPDAPSMGPPPGPPPAIRAQIPSMAPPSRPPPGRPPGPPPNNNIVPPPNRPPPTATMIPTFTPMINTPYANAMMNNSNNQNRPPPAPTLFSLNDGFSNYPSPAPVAPPPRKAKEGRKNERKKTRTRIDADAVLTPSAEKLKQYANMLPYTANNSFDDKLVKKKSKNKNSRNGHRRRKNSKNDSSYGSYGENETPGYAPRPIKDSNGPVIPMFSPAPAIKQDNAGPTIPMFSPAPSFAGSFQTYDTPTSAQGSIFVYRGEPDKPTEVKRKKKVRRKQKLNKFSDRKLEPYSDAPRNSPQRAPKGPQQPNVPNPYGKPKPQAYLAKKEDQKKNDTLSFEGSSRQIAQVYNAPSLSPNKNGDFPPMPPPRKSDEDNGLRTKSLGLQIMVSKKFGKNPNKLRPMPQLSPKKGAPPPLPDRKNKPVPSQLYTPAPPNRGRNNAPPGLGWSRFLGPV